MRYANSPRANDVPRVPGFTEDHLPHTILHPTQFRIRVRDWIAANPDQTLVLVPEWSIFRNLLRTYP